MRTRQFQEASFKSVTMSNFTIQGSGMIVFLSPRQIQLCL